MTPLARSVVLFMRLSNPEVFRGRLKKTQSTADSQATAVD